MEFLFFASFFSNCFLQVLLFRIRRYCWYHRWSRTKTLSHKICHIFRVKIQILFFISSNFDYYSNTESKVAWNESHRDIHIMNNGYQTHSPWRGDEFEFLRKILRITIVAAGTFTLWTMDIRHILHDEVMNLNSWEKS